MCRQIDTYTKKKKYQNIKKGKNNRNNKTNEQQLVKELREFSGYENNHYKNQH